MNLMNHKNHDMDTSNIQSVPQKRQSPQLRPPHTAPTVDITPTVEKDRHSINTTHYFEHSLLLLKLLLLLFPHDDDNAKKTTVSTLRVKNRHLQKSQRIGTWERVVVIQQQQQQRRLFFYMSSFFFLCYFIHLNPLMSLLCEAFTVTTTTVMGGDRNRHYDNIHSDHHQQPARAFPLSATVEDGDTTDLFPNSAVAAAASSSSIQEDTTTVRGIRLNKIFTKLYSRRSTETLIRDGRIRVNQDIVTDLGRRVIPYQDIVWLDDEIYSNWETHIVYDYKNTDSNIHHDNKNAAASTKQQQPPHMSSSSSSSSHVQTNEHNDRSSVVPTTVGSSEDHRLPHVYIKYWKPVGVISTTDRNVRDNLLDAIYRGCGMTSYPQHSTRPYNTHGHDLQNGRRIFNVGRLDKDTSGLILLTSDGRVPNIVLSKQFVHTKVYQVILDKPITYEHIQQLRRGIVITTDTIRQRKHVSYTARTLPCTVEPMYHNTPRSHIPLTTLISETESSSSSSSSTYIPTKEIQITLIEGRNRQIRVMLQSVGSYQVVQLHRIEFMSTIDLTNLHGPGDWTYLNTTEVASLEQAIASSSSSLQYNDTAIRRRSSKSLLW